MLAIEHLQNNTCLQNQRDQQDQEITKEEFHFPQKLNIPPITRLLRILMLDFNINTLVNFKPPKRFLREKKLLALTYQPACEIKKPEKLPECKICFEDINLEDTFLPKDCGHKFHNACMKAQIAQSKEMMKFPAICPHDGCDKALTLEQIKGLLDTAEMNDYLQAEKKFKCMTEPELYRFCPTPDCTYIFEINTQLETQQCEQCLKLCCAYCGLPEHPEMDCTEAKEAAGDDPEFFGLIKDALFKRCAEYKFYIERSEGCHHMTCTCGHEFCFLCGLVWQTCECYEDG